MKEEWICTDYDNQQYGRQVDTNIYEFKEKNRGLLEYDEDEFIQIIIDLDDYSYDCANECVLPYYSGIDEVKQIYGVDFEWIIAECIFEQESGLY
jgi:hypothetical protein